jgi:hypothetical protein
VSTADGTYKTVGLYQQNMWNDGEQAIVFEGGDPMSDS